MSRGFTYLGVLFALALLGVMLLSVQIMFGTQKRSQAEAELLYVGEQYRDAIRRYAAAHAKAADPFPKELAALLQDPDVLEKRRYLRRLYHDPVTGSADWGLVRTPSGSILGVYSKSERKPVRQANFGPGEENFANAARYTEWRFAVALPPGFTAAGMPNAVGSGSGVTLLPQTASTANTDNGTPPPALSPCLRVVPNDMRVCETIRALHGEAAYYNCATSASARAQFCVSNPNARFLPALDVR